MATEEGPRPGETYNDWVRRMAAKERAEGTLGPPTPTPPPERIEEGPRPGESYNAWVRRMAAQERAAPPTEEPQWRLIEARGATVERPTDAPQLKVTGKSPVQIEQERLGQAEARLRELEIAHKEAPPGYEHETYAEYEKHYQEEYLPIYQRLSGIQEARRAEQWRGFAGELMEAGLTESEVEAIWVNLGYLETATKYPTTMYGGKVLTPEEAQARWEQYMAQWGLVTAQRAKESYLETLPEPAWYAVKKSPIGDIPIFGEFATAYVKAMDPFGKWIAETVTGKSIETRPRGELPFTPATFFGEVTAYYGLGVGAGMVAGGAIRVFGPPIAKAIKIVTVDPFTKAAPHISTTVASQWAAAGTKVAGLGKTALAHPTAMKVAAYGAWGGYETWKVKGMVEAGVPWERIVGLVGRDIALIVGFGRGFAKGLEAESPIGIGRVKVGERTLYTGLRVGQRPVIGKTPEGWALGWPKYTPKTTKGFLLYAAKVEYAPGTMFESRFVSKELFPALKRITPGEYAGAMKSWGIRLSTKGARPLVKRDIVEVWRDIFARQKIGQKAYEDVLKVLRSQAKRIEFYGSSVKQAQTAGIYAVPEEYAVPGDIDVMVKNVSKLADDVVKAINKYHPGAAWVRTSRGGTTMIVTKYGKLFDVHAAGYGDVLPSVKWGLGAEPKIKISGFKVTTLSEETTHAWWSIGTLREAEGKIMFWPETGRVKDVWRFLGAEAELSISKGVPSKFPPVEQFWLGKLQAMGYTPEQIAAMMKEAAKASRLIYSATPTLSYPSLAISSAAIPIISSLSSWYSPSRVLSSVPSSVLSSSRLPSYMQPSAPSRGAPSYKPPSLPSGLSLGYPSISSVFSPLISPYPSPSPYPYSPPPSSPPYSYPPSPPKPSRPSGFPPILQLGEPEAEPRQSFDVYVKRKQMKKGKGSYLSRGFKKVNVKPLSKESALGLGMSIVDQFTNAQGFIKKRRDKPGRTSRKYEHLYHQLRHKFRFPRRKGKASLRNRFIEKTTFRIDSPAELSGIPYEAQRLRKAGLIGAPARVRIPRQRVVSPPRRQLANVLAQPRVKARAQRRSAKLGRIFGEESEKKKVKVFG